MGDKPFKSLDGKVDGEKKTLDIPRRPKSITDPTPITNGTSAETSNGVSATNGNKKVDDDLESVTASKKRAAPEDTDVPSAKRGKVDADEPITLDDDGAILIDDD